MKCESEMTRALCAELRKYNAVCYVISGGSEYMRPGLPDRFLSHKWLPGGCWLEFKAGNNQCSQAQKWVIGEMAERGTNVFVCRHKVQLEDRDGNQLAPWDGTAGDLLEKLKGLMKNGTP